MADYIEVLWTNITQRCTNPRHPDYAYYGARGITIYSRWQGSSLPFREDILGELGPRPDSSYTLDRKDNSKGYEPGNLRWATRSEQALNRRRPKTFKSKLKGVTWNRGTNKWMAQAGVRGKHTYLGLHATEEEAGRAYDKWALATYGPDYAYFNFREE